ncbi:BTB/POZ domain-containing protein 6-like [Paramacrobiotus metropolitanus]|uniref:BTB/POZ domain-containing protein 6-like n=1 Tax=Paramacrobiotus metropolitanus TaxID=2943436 RepID=UPI002445CB82|nr:BTB/POZ domain-containing protein 6-like [Paramacrobiotus metropolitanus]
MFRGSVPETGDKPIKISDVTAETFGNVLSYLYTDRTDDLKMENAFETLYCAEKYGIPSLFNHCSQFIVSRLDSSNCLISLEKALRFSADSVIKGCLEFIDANCKAVLDTPQFLAVQHEILEKILQRNTLAVDENTVYKAVDRWASNACAEAGIDSSAENRRQVLGAALYLVRFPLLTDGEIANGPLKVTQIRHGLFYQNTALLLWTLQSGLLLKEEFCAIYEYLYKHGADKPHIPFPATPRVHLLSDYPVRHARPRPGALLNPRRR